MLVRVRRLHVLGVNSSASVTIETKATSTPRRTCDTRRTVSHEQFPSAARPQGWALQREVRTRAGVTLSKSFACLPNAKKALYRTCANCRVVLPGPFRSIVP